MPAEHRALPAIPVRDYRKGGLSACARGHAAAARRLMETVLRGMGAPGRALGPLLPLADRIAARHLRRIADPYRDEITALPAAIGRPGPIAFALSYEFGCTARAFPGGTLFRTLDWPFHGLGALAEIVRLPGAAGEWVTVTWPGVMGVLHGAAPGRFAAALNQAPERTGRLGHPAAWLAGRRHVLAGRGLPPPHLLRLAFETAPDFAAAREMLTQTPVAVPVIFTLAGPTDACVIERTERKAMVRDSPAIAANHFETPPEPHRHWRPRGHDSTGRAAQAAGLAAPPPLEALAAPILNPLTRLAVTMDSTGAIAAAGYEGAHRVTAPGRFDPAA